MLDERHRNDTEVIDTGVSSPAAEAVGESGWRKVVVYSLWPLV